MYICSEMRVGFAFLKTFRLSRFHFEAQNLIPLIEHIISNMGCNAMCTMAYTHFYSKYRNSQADFRCYSNFVMENIYKRLKCFQYTFLSISFRRNVVFLFRLRFFSWFLSEWISMIWLLPKGHLTQQTQKKVTNERKKNCKDARFDSLIIRHIQLSCVYSYFGIWFLLIFPLTLWFVCNSCVSLQQWNEWNAQIPNTLPINVHTLTKHCNETTEWNEKKITHQLDV